MPAYFSLDKVIKYLYNNMNVKEYILASNRDQADPMDHIELGLNRPLDGGDEEYFSLDNRLDLNVIYSYIYIQLIDKPTYSERGQAEFYIIFRKKVLYQTQATLDSMHGSGVTPGQ